MNERDDIERRLSRLREDSESLRASPGFEERVMLAALAAPAPETHVKVARPLWRAMPVAMIAAALAVVWAFASEESTDEAFAVSDETVELQW
jgi:hypothetical protein